ncbi:MAG: ABC transporter permease [Chloroflexi bacterium]|nr:ABC transporter permease [Chloroflexota bacterium]
MTQREPPSPTPSPAAPVGPNKHTRVRSLRGWAGSALVVAAVIGAWQGVVALFDIPAWKLPAPSAIGAELVASRALFLRHAWVTLQEVLLGFGVALALGVILAGLIASFPTFQRAVYPFVIASQTVPIIVIAPLLLIWVGYGLAPKIIVVALIAFFPIVVNTVDGLRGVDADMVNMMRTLGASRRQVFVKVQIPTALPFLFSGVKVAITFSVIGAVIGEWVGASAGLGYLTRVSVPLFLTARSFGAVVILSAMGVSLFLAVALLERLLLPWYHTERRQRALERS